MNKCDIKPFMTIKELTVKFNPKSVSFLRAQRASTSSKSKILVLVALLPFAFVLLSLSKGGDQTQANSQTADSISRLGQIAKPADEVPVFAGTGYQRGLAQAEYFGGQIQIILDAVLDNYLNSWWAYLWASYQSRSMEEYIPSDLLEEMRGIADGTGISYRDILIGNLLSDLSQLWSTPAGCSALVVMPERSSHRGLLVGRNLDWYHDIAPLMRESMRAVIFAAPGKNQILSVTIPGMVGVLTGINDRGVMLSMMYSAHRDQSPDGVPVSILYRRVLEESESFGDALDTIQGTQKRTIGVNTLLTDREQAGVIEMTATLTVLRKSQGLLFSANHFESSEMIGDAAPERDYRWPALTRLAAHTGDINFEDVKTTVEETAMDDEYFEGVLGVVMDYGTNSLHWGTGGPPAGAFPFHAIDLSEIFFSSASPSH